MTPLQFVILLFLISIGAEVLGSLLGLGGGIIVIPALTLLFGIDIRYQRTRRTSGRFEYCAPGTVERAPAAATN